MTVLCSDLFYTDSFYIDGLTDWLTIYSCYFCYELAELTDRRQYATSYRLWAVRTPIAHPPNSLQRLVFPSPFHWPSQYISGKFRINPSLSNLTFSQALLHIGTLNETVKIVMHCHYLLCLKLSNIAVLF